MPEYLAPGVYVEETSFRSKSIEGVGTSTTAFVGPTLKGPSGVTPELLTSFGDFERIYGGFKDINGTTNYIAHAVRAYFDNGGSRLYVSRVVPSSALPAQSEDLVRGTPEVRFEARFPGEGGNGEIILSQKANPVSFSTLSGAPIGSILRIGGTPARPAQISGTTPGPFSLNNEGKLLLTVNNSDREITFLGQSAEAVSHDALATQIDLTAAPPLTVRIGQNGRDQLITLPTGNQVTLDAVVSAINRQLRGGYARLTDASDPAGTGKLAIGTELQGKAAWIQITTLHDQLKFTSTEPVDGSTNANNNVNDLEHVTVAEIDQLLQLLQPPEIQATLIENKLLLNTIDTGETAQLGVRDGIDSVHTALGLQIETKNGETGNKPKYYLKQANDWEGQNDAFPIEANFNQAADILTLTLVAIDKEGNEVSYENLGFDSRHPRWIGNVLAKEPKRRADYLANPFAITVSNNLTALALREALFISLSESRKVALTGGGSGSEPSVEAYRDALEQLESLEDISIVAAPGHSAYAGFESIQDALITHVSRRRAYQIAVLDTPPNQTLNGARTVRSRIDSSYAALYYPWVVVANPLARPGVANVPAELNLPPSGFICGIYARNDIERGVYKAPANEIVRGALRFETDINFAQQEVLNPLGINCLRFFPGRGYRVWGARTASSDPEWKYVNVRRYFNYLEASIDRSTQWAVFEPNGDRLWANVRDTIAGFLYNEWVSGALLGSSPQQAYFVRCDRSTITQNDLDNGRLICLIGVAAIKPAEFVIFRIGQKTADSRS